MNKINQIRTVLNIVFMIGAVCYYHPVLYRCQPDRIFLRMCDIHHYKMIVVRAPILST